MTLLDKQTLNKVKTLCKTTCCNYIDGKCALTDSTCDYFTKAGGNVSCDWFEQCVLPNDKELKASYEEQHGISYTETEIGKYSRICKACSNHFKTDTKNKLTCSEECRKELRKQTNSAYYLRQS